MGSDEEEAGEFSHDSENSDEDGVQEDEDEEESLRKVGNASKYDDFKKKEEDGEFDEISKHAAMKIKNKATENGIRRSGRNTKRIKYTDDYDSDEFNDESNSEEEDNNA